MPNEPLYSIGAYLRRRSAPDRAGLVRSCRWSDQTDEWVYKVLFSAPPLREVPETDLEPVPEDGDPWQDLLDGRTEGAAVYQKLLTYERVNRPPSRVAASFGIARAKLLPYQFKPLLKFLDSTTQRLLIADDVGLGKTIEAGYILKELRARHGIEQCLIVVPARLRTKWRRELEDRFDERFQLVGSSDIRTSLLDRIRDGREPEPFLWITSYESVRRPEIVKGLQELQPAIDLVVMDEAHRVRNVSTEQNRMARVLSECATAMLLLTATPVQTSLENLFQLLRLIDSETFSNYTAFEHQLSANQPVVKALALVRSGTREGLEQARAELEKLARHPLTVALSREPFVISLLERLTAEDPKDRGALVELQRDIGELSLTSSVISRTRKIDVMPDRPVRKAQSVRVRLTEAEKQIYDAVAMRFIDRALTGSPGVTMAMLQSLRLTASCIPAAVDYFAETLRGEMIEGDRDAALDDSSWTVVDEQSARPKGHLAVPSLDSKFEEFLKALKAVWTDEAGASRKVIVFAFFLPTLRYLSERLSRLRIEHRVIHGKVPIPERERRIEDFIANGQVRVLLSSEVGSEGVDLQVASVVVNYDLPWNPMVVEQRIGRVDRIGQESKVISIVNLVLENTVVDRVLLRLYERIHLFERTMGEMEDILGETIETLALQLLRQELTPEEAVKQADTRADAFLNEQRQAAALQDRSDQLLAGDQAFLDEVEGLIGDRKVPGPDELYRFLRNFLDERFPGCEFPPDVVRRSVEVRLQPQMGSVLQAQFPGATDVRRFAGRIQAGSIPITMDSDAYMRVGSAEFVSIHHCLVRLACAQIDKDDENLHRTFRLRLTPDENWETGEYLVAIIEFDVTGIRPRTELRPIAIKLGTSEPLLGDVARRMFVKSLDRGESFEQRSLASRDALTKAIDRLKQEADRERAALKQSEATLGALRAARRRATQEGTLKQRVKAAKDRLTNLRANGASDFPIRMAVFDQHVPKSMPSWISLVLGRVAFPDQPEDAALPRLPHELTAADLATLVVAYLIQVATEAAVRYTGGLNEGPQSPRPGISIGVPMSLGQDAQRRDRFVNIARTALNLCQNGAPSLENGLDVSRARDLLDQANTRLGVKGPVRDPRDWVRSEAEAGLLWLFESPRVASGLYVCVDVGAGTTDVSVFRIVDRYEESAWVKAKLAFYSAVSSRPGLDALDDVISSLLGEAHAEVRAIEDDLIRQHRLTADPRLRAVLQKIFAVYQEGWRQGYRKHKAQSDWQPFGLFVLGGGSKIEPVVMVLRQSPWNGGLDGRVPRPNEFPNDLFELPTRGASQLEPFTGDAAFLLVAYGLSFMGGDVPPVDAPDQMTEFEPPRTPRRSIDQDEYYPK